MKSKGIYSGDYSMVSEAYMHELDYRIKRALTHWEAMQDKYAETPEDANESIGYGKWEKAVKRRDGSTLYHTYEAPLPHYYLYYSYFLELITSLPEHNIIPTIESTFHGDGIDLDYIEWLIKRYNEAGVLEKGGPIFTDDIDGMLLFGKEGCTIEHLTEIGIDEERIIDPECDIARRFEIVQGWINEKRHSPTYLPVIVTNDREVAEHLERIDEPAPSAPQHELPEKSTAPPALLSSSDLILGTGFTLNDADLLARAVKLIDDDGKYCLGRRKLGAVVGFALALQQAGKLTGAIPALTAVLGPRWGVNVATRKTTTGVAQKYFKLMSKVLDRPKKTE